MKLINIRLHWLSLSYEELERVGGDPKIADSCCRQLTSFCILPRVPLEFSDSLIRHRFRVRSVELLHLFNHSYVHSFDPPHVPTIDTSVARQPLQREVEHVGKIPVRRKILRVFDLSRLMSQHPRVWIRQR